MLAEPLLSIESGAIRFHEIDDILQGLTSGNDQITKEGIKMSTVTEVIEQIGTYILRCHLEENYQGTHDEQVFLQNIKENYKKLSQNEQCDVQDNYHILYSQSITPYQKRILEQADEYASEAATVAAMGGAVGGIVLGAGFVKIAMASGICALAGRFFANRNLVNSSQNLAIARRKLLALDRIKAIIGHSKPSPEVKLSLPDLNEGVSRRRMPGSR